MKKLRIKNKHSQINSIYEFNNKSDLIDYARRKLETMDFFGEEQSLLKDKLFKKSAYVTLNIDDLLELLNMERV